MWFGLGKTPKVAIRDRAKSTTGHYTRAFALVNLPLAIYTQ